MSRGPTKKKGLRPTAQAPVTVFAQCEPFPPPDVYHVSQDRGDLQVASGPLKNSPPSYGLDVLFPVSGSSLISPSPPRTPPSTAAKPLTSVPDDEPAASTSTSAPPPYSYQTAAGSPSSDSRALALVADELTRGVVDVRPKLAHEGGQQSEKLSERKRTIDLKEDALANVYAKIERLKAENVAQNAEIVALRTENVTLTTENMTLKAENVTLNVGVIGVSAEYIHLSSTACI
jgi:hypothetical protein